MKSIFTNAKVIGSQIDPAVYHHQTAQRGQLDFVQSRSDLMSVALCAHRWRLGYKSPDSGAKEYGSLLDSMVLDWDRFGDKYTVAPLTYTSDKGETKDWNWNATVCKEWRNRQAGKIIVKNDDYKEGLSALDRLRECTPAALLRNCSQKQVMVMAEYQDAGTGLTIHVKALIDLVPSVSDKTFGRCLGDFKTARSANPRKWARESFNCNYEAQAALYQDIYVAATGEDRTDFVHLVQENYAPYEVLTPFPILSTEFLEIGRMKYVSALKFYAACLKQDVWPSYKATELVMDPFQIVSPEPWMILAGDLGSAPPEPLEEQQPARITDEIIP